MLGRAPTSADTTSFLCKRRSLLIFEWSQRAYWSLHPVEEKVDADDRNGTCACSRHARLKRLAASRDGLCLDDEDVPREAERFLRRATHWTLELVLHALDVARRVKRLSAAADSCCTAAERRETNRALGFSHETTYF